MVLTESTLVSSKSIPRCDYCLANRRLLQTRDQVRVRSGVRLVAHHYLLSFGMYWAHRSLHVVPFLWSYIHSIHHWARHPLSHNTYQDHWADNFGNAIVGEVAAQDDALVHD